MKDYRNAKDYFRHEEIYHNGSMMLGLHARAGTQEKRYALFERINQNGMRSRCHVIAFMPEFFGWEVNWASGCYINNISLSDAEDAFWNRIE